MRELLMREGIRKGRGFQKIMKRIKSMKGKDEEEERKQIYKNESFNE